MKTEFAVVLDIISARKERLREAREAVLRYAPDSIGGETIVIVIEELEAVAATIAAKAQQVGRKRVSSPAQEAARKIAFAKAIAVRRENIARKKAATAELEKLSADSTSDKTPAAPANDAKATPAAPPPSTPQPMAAPQPAPAPAPIRAQPAQASSQTAGGGKKTPLNIEAEQLFAQGATARDVSDELGVGLNTVAIWLMIWRNEQKKAAAR